MRKLALVLLAATLAFTGCSSDDGDDAEAADTTTSVPAENQITTETTIRALKPEEIDTTRSPYCATWADIRSAGGPQTQGLDEAAATARRKEYYGSLLPKVEQLLTQAPDDIRSAVEIARDATRATSETGSFDPFRTEEAKESASDLAQYALDNCAKAGV